MNLLNDIIDKSVFENGKLYLLNKPSNDFGFFYQDGIVYFAKKSMPSTTNSSVDTAYLDMNLCVYITSDNSTGSFETGNYDMLAFKDKLEGIEFDAFYNICVSYANDSSDLDFSDFFSSLVELFKKTKEGSTKNLIGLIGELLLIKKIYEDYEINISENWHLTGSNSKFDFSFEQFNLEVKTTTSSEMKFLLKHDQIFNNQKNYIAVVSLIETGDDESIETLSKYFSTTEPFKNNVKFQIAIQKELLKVTEKKDKKRSFALDDVEIFDCEKMQTITNIPGCISKIEYYYNFSDLDSIEIESIFE